jgi:hypothetical protein
MVLHNLLGDENVFECLDYLHDELGILLRVELQQFVRDRRINLLRVEVLAQLAQDDIALLL